MASNGKEMRVPMKRMAKGEKITLNENVRASGSKSENNWTGESACKRVSNDLDVFNALTAFMIDLTEEEEGGGKSKCSKVAISMIAFLIKQKFNNDTFIASKLHFFYIYASRFVSNWVNFIRPKPDRKKMRE